MTNYGAEEPWPLPPKASSSRLRFLSNLASTLEFYWVLPDFTRFYRVLPGFTGFYRVFTEFLPSCYRVFTELCGVDW